MDFETCYVYKPTQNNTSRPSKRRRVDEPSGLHSSWPARRSVYQRIWSSQEQRLTSLQLEINQLTISQIDEFIHETPQHLSSDKVPSALILTGPSIASHALLFDQLSNTTKKSDDNVFVTLTSGVAPNLKTLLKHLIQRATASDASPDDDNDEEAPKSNQKRPRLLNYDLQLLYEHFQENNFTRVVVAFQDCEAFDGHLLSEVIELLSSWLDRIPFVFLFGVATSIEDFQAKLSKRAARCIQGRRFDVVKAETALEQAFEDIHSKETKIWIGPGLCDTMLRRQRDHIQSLDAFKDSIHYAYLSHFYANALTIFLDDNFSNVPDDHFKALRQLPSFQLHVQSLLENRQTSQVRELLDSDQNLLHYLREHLAMGQSALHALIKGVDVLYAVQKAFPAVQMTPRSALVVDALRGELREFPWERTLLLRLRKSNSATLQTILQEVQAVSDGSLKQDCKVLINELNQLLQGQGDDNGPLRSAEDLQNSTLRTTVIAKKVELSKQKSTMSKGDTAYSDLLRRFTILIEEYLSDTLIDPKSLVFNEIFIYDLRSPHRDVFTPKPRFAIERALAAPHDYLDCACCAPTDSNGNEDGENTLSSTQPATAVLYQLYLESGAMINASDLRTAFFAIMNPDEQDEAMTSALFQRSLAELKYLGLVRGTRKKADHIMKMSWRGL